MNQFYNVQINAVDKSIQVKDYNTPSVLAALLAGEFIHVGLYKPFRQMFLDFSVLNAVATTITFEYYNGTTWVAMPDLVDETEHFIKSGFIYFPRPSNWASTTVNSEEGFFIRMSGADDLTVTTSINGISVLFSNDKDLEGVKSNIVSKLNGGNTWIEKHESAKRLVIQKLRNLGNVKVDPTVLDSIDKGDKVDSIHYKDLTEFDLFEPFQLREAAKFYALSMIYLDELSDEVDDKYERAGIRHEGRADEAINLFLLQIDTDDDGIQDPKENKGTTRTELTWE